MATRRTILTGLVATAATGPVSAQIPRPQKPPTNTDEAQVGSYVLPDPMQLANGERVRDAKTWTAVRRPEIMRLFQENQHGVIPAARKAARYQVVDHEVMVFDGLAQRTQVRIRFSDRPDAPVIRVLLHVPVAAKRPVPTLLHIGFSPPALLLDQPGLDVGQVWSSKTDTRIPDREAPKVLDFNAKTFQHFLERGYAVAYVYYGDIEPDYAGGAAHGVRSLFGPQGGPRQPDEWGSLGAWSWGLSRVLDYLQTNSAVDGRQVALSGMSRLGKAVIWAGACDERFAVVIPMASGEGGCTISRRNYGETIADLTDPERFPYWFAPRYADYAFDVPRLPVDGHMLVALIAPRPILQVCGSADTWSDPKGEFIASLAAKPVYELFGKRGIDLTTYPGPDTKSLNDMGYYLHDGPHTTLPADFAVMSAFLDKHLVRRA
jgi:hypothetical protein